MLICISFADNTVTDQTILFIYFFEYLRICLTMYCHLITLIIMKKFAKLMLEPLINVSNCCRVCRVSENRDKILIIFLSIDWQEYN